MGNEDGLAQVLVMLTESIKQNTQTNNKLDNTIEAIRKEMRQEYVQKQTLEPQLHDIREDIKKLGNNWDWLIKIVAAIIIAAILSLIIVQGGKPL